MRPCYVCGGTYRDMLVIHYKGEDRSFDCFECAIHALAPACETCRCPVIGHGIDVDGSIYCCSHCASHARTGIHERPPDIHAPARRPSAPHPREGQHR